MGSPGSTVSSFTLGSLHEAILEFGLQKDLESFWRIVGCNTRWLVPSRRLAVISHHPDNRFEIIGRFQRGRYAALSGVCFADGSPAFCTAFSRPDCTWLDVQDDHHAMSSPLESWLFERRPRTLLFVPVFGQGERLATLVLDVAKLEVTERERSALLMTVYALHAGMMFQILQSNISRARRERELQQINLIGRALVESSTVEEILATATERVRAAFGVEYARVVMGEPEAQTLRVAAEDGPSPVRLGGGPLAAEVTHVGEVIRDGVPRRWLISDGLTERYADLRSAGEHGVRCGLTAPLRLNDRVAGAITVMSVHADALSEYHLGLLEQLANAVASSFRRRTEVDLQRAKELAEAGDRAKSELIAHVSHEIRTPMNGVIGMTELLSDSPLTPTQREHLETIQLSAKTMLGIVDDLLDASKIEAGKLILEAAPFSPDRVIKEVINSLRPVAEKKGIELSATGTVGLNLMGDALRLRQIFTNLVSNAIKFTAEGSVTFEGLLLACENGRASLEFSVHDTGIGIAPEKLELIFERFTQAEDFTARRFGGTGLGLAICRNLTACMGGRVFARSEVGRGSTFTVQVELPTASDMPVEVEGVVEGALASGIRVLLVDDNRVNRRVAGGMLERLGCQVQLATNGLEAVSIATAGSFDIILMDCQMPDMDGMEATKRIRQWEQDRGSSARLPILALTASALSDDRARCLAAGMDDHLSKPITKRVLERALLRFVAGAP